ncbi:acetyl-CoA synthetase-like protein [Dentipellis sp. KUC8613]|nr:acetyl-CoA synthetase-like protein [Dentipellis sp. KUC8613]
MATLDRTVPLPPNVDYRRQSVPVPGTKRSGQTAHYRNGAFGLFDAQATGTTPLRTLPEVFENGLNTARDLSLLGHRPIVSTNPLKFADHYVWQTWAEVDVRRRHIGSAVHQLFQSGKLGGGELPSVGLWSQNRPEWQLVDFALHAYGKVGVSLYDTLGKDSVEHIINHSHLTIIFATSNHIPQLLKLAPRTPHLNVIVSIDVLSPELRQTLVAWGETVGVEIKDLPELEEFGKAHLSEIQSATPDQLASICYTSGTTSTPKGVLLTHGQMAAAVQSNLYGYSIPKTERGCVLSYLPLAHIYERTNELCVIATGGSIGFFTGDPLRLLEDAQLLKPNFFPSVPRVLNRIYQAAMVAGNVPGLKGAIFRRAVAAKLQKIHTTGDNTHALWDRIVFKKIQAVLGGNLKLVTCGSAPITAEVMDFLRVALACDILEGYGMTENAAVCSHVWPGDPTSSGTVGPVSTGMEVKLVDVPTMGYTSEDKPNPRGELCCRGPMCFKGYYKDENSTSGAIDEEKWVHTGDVAEIDECGRLRIIDRVKNIMKLAQGEYVALEKIENLYSSLPLVGQIFVHGESLQAYLLAVVVPDPVQFAQLASQVTGQAVSESDAKTLQELCSDERIVQAVLAELTREGKKNHLKGFEMVKRIHLTMDPFSVEDNTMTPTLKIRRKDAYQKHKAALDALYQLGELPSGKAQL